MRWALVAIGVAACGPKPPPAQPIDNEPELEHRVAAPRRFHVALLPRPAIDISPYVPDFHDELRWPLSGMNHPVLEPHFNVAQELAAPGIDWQELCARGVQNRVSATQKELLSYLHGWCDVQKRDIDTACQYLTPLIGSTTRGLTQAVRQDLANILVEQGADKAEHWLTKHNIRDMQVLDLLAANFVEVGTMQDAFAINRRAIDEDTHATDATKCRRLTRRIALGRDADQTFAIEALRDLATKPKVPDSECVRLHHKVACSLNPARDCLGYITDEYIDSRALSLLDAYYNWPRTRVDVYVWWRIAGTAQGALPLPGAAELVITALEASQVTDALCPGERALSVNEAIADIRRDPRNLVYEPRLKPLEHACPMPELPKGAPAASEPAPVPPTKP